MWKRAYWALVAATALLYGTMLFWAGPRLREMTAGGGLPFDLRMFGYSRTEAQEYIAALTPGGAEFYLGPAAMLDTLFPGMFTAVLVIGGWWLLARRPLILRLCFALVALGYGLFDYLENAAVRQILGMSGGPEALPAALVATASRWTVLKFLFVDVAILVLAGLLISSLARRLFAGRRGRVFTVAIDGPAAAGKGTISRAVAEAFDLAHLDTGSLYRAVGVKALEMGGLDPDTARRAAETLGSDDLAREDLRTGRAADAASQVAAWPAVRTTLLAFQRKFAHRPGGAVLDGRDIGTVICPDAQVKLYVTASAEVRAARRFKELAAAGSSQSYQEVLDDVRARDERDANRDAAPLRAAGDAVEIDTTRLTIEQAAKRALEVVERALNT